MLAKEEMPWGRRGTVGGWFLPRQPSAISNVHDAAW